MFVYVQYCTYTGTHIVRIREQELFVYVNCLFVYVHFGSNTSQFAPLQTRVYAKICTSTMCLYVEFCVCIRTICCPYTNTNFYVEAQHVVPLRRKVVRLQSVSTSNFASLRMRLYVEKGCSYTNMRMFVYKHKFHVEARIEM